MIDRANRALVVVHLLLAVGAVVGAVISLVMFSHVDQASDDGLSGFLVVYAAAGLVFAGVVGLLGLLALRARTASQAAGYSVALGAVVLFLLLVPATFVAGIGGWGPWAALGGLALPLALVVTSSVGLRQPPPTTAAPRS